MKRAIRWIVTMVLPLALGACGGGGNGGGAATFSKSFGGAGHDEARAAMATRDGGYVFVGGVNGDREGRATDLWISKLDSGGNVEWQRALGGRAASDGDRRRLFAVVRPTSAGGTVVAGRATAPSTDDPGARADHGPTGDDLWIARYDAAGQLEWQRELDSGAWPGLAFAPSNHGRGAWADDVADDVRALPDGGAIVVATSTGNVRDASSGAVTVAATSLFVVRLGAGGEVLWQRRFGDRRQNTVHPRVEAAPDNGAVLAYTGEFGQGPQLRIVRLDAGGSIAWEVFEDLATVVALRALQDGGVAVAHDPFGEDSRLLRIDRDGRVQWRRGDDRTTLAALEERCVPPAPCELVVAGTRHVEGDPDDAILEPRGLVQRVSASGDLLAEHAIADAGFFVDVYTVDDGHIATVEREAQPRGRARRLVLDAANLRPVAVSAPFALPGGVDGVRPTEALLASATRVLATHQGTQRWQWFESPDALADAVQAGQAVQLERAGGDDVALGVVEVAPNSFIVGGSSDSSDGLSAPWLARITDGRIDWQRRIAATGGGLHAMTAGPDGGVVIAAGGGGAARVVGLTADGRIAWESGELTGFDVRELKALDDGIVAVGESTSPSSSIWRFDSAGRLIWQRRFDAVAAHSIDVVGDGGFVVAAAAGSDEGIVRVMRLDASGDVQWRRSYGVAGAAAAPAARAKVRHVPGGGFVVGASETGVVAPSSRGQPFGQANVLLLRVDAAGDVLWTRSYGGFLDERLHDLQVMADGGLLVAGASDSLGEGSEAWLLRLAADGSLAPGCNAELAALPPAAITTRAFVGSSRAAGTLRPVATPAVAIDTSFAPTTPHTVTARQCAATAETTPAPGATFTLTVEESGPQAGVVTSTPEGLVCGTAASPPPCTAPFEAGSDVVLRVDIGSVRHFVRWEDCDEQLAPDSSGASRCRVRMDRDRRVRAVFGEAPSARYRLSVEVTGLDGIVESSDHGIICTSSGPDCEELYVPGTSTVLSFELLRAAGRFAGWGGDCAASGSAATATVVMDADKRCTARFSSPS